MDPRTFTVKQCEPAYAQKSGAAIGNATSERRDFFNSIGKIGDLEVLNSIGGGTIGKGLRTLASISNSIRVGEGALPTSIGTSLDTGANWVLEQTGIAPTLVDALRPFQPGIANQAYGQAKSIYEKVRQGNFSFTDIPNYLQDLQNLEQLGRGIFVPSNGDVQAALGEHCQASAYAMDLIARHPKYKFLFVVQFIPGPEYGPLGGQDFGPLDMAFAVKRSTRPSIKYVMDDVNYYNFRTKVVTRTEFDEMEMTFHDDTLNLATAFYHAYMRAMSPVTGIGDSGAQSDLLEQGGMDFVGRTLNQNEILNQISASTYAASTGPLAGDQKQIFSEIRLYHVFDNGHRMNVWRFFNPRISDMSMDDLDMSVGNEGCELSINFNYDSVYLDPDVSMADDKYNLKQTQRGAMYPLRYNGPTGTSMSSFGSIPGLDVGAFGGASDIINNASAAFNDIQNTASAAIDNLSSQFSNPFGG